MTRSTIPVASKLSTFVTGSDVITSHQLADRLEAADINRVLARQWMRREAEGEGVWRSEALELAGRGRLFARRDKVGTAAFLMKAAEVLAEERPGISRAIKKLIANGVLLRSEAAKILASPQSGSSAARFSTYSQDVAALEELKAGKVDGDGTAIEWIARPSLHGEASGHALAMKQHGEVLLQAHIARMLVDHFRRQGLISWEGHELPPDGEGNVVFNDFQFCASSFSWLSPMLRWSNNNPKPLSAPVVIDVVARRCDEEDAHSFAHRISRARGNPRSGLKILGILAAFDFGKPAWKLSKENGFLTVNLRQAFGDAAVKAMEKMRELLAFVGGDTNLVKEADLDALATNLEQLKSNPYVTELKSVALEIWAALYLSDAGYESVRTNLIVPFQNTSREIDASGMKASADKAYVIECKAEGASKELDADYVDKFFKETVPAYLSHHWKSHAPSECVAEIWTTGKVGQAAKDRLSALRTKPYINARLLDASEIEAKVPRGLSSAKRLIKNIGVA